MSEWSTMQEQAPPFPYSARRPAALRLGPLTLSSRYLLAPLAGYTNLSFRMAVRGLGGMGLATTDLVNARALMECSRKTMELLQTCPEDRPVAVQIYGSIPAEMRAAAQWLEEYGVSSVDINMGCPVHKVVRGGGGSALLCDAVHAVALVRSVVEAVRIPVTVKMRLGWDEDTLTAPWFAREFEQAGVAAVTIHGRTRAQGFAGGVNLDGIRAVVEAVEHIPILGNGDVRTISAAAHMLGYTGCAGIAIGRGALLNPWIFSQLHSWETTREPHRPASYRQRLEFMDRHFHLLLGHRGERFACLTFRKVANWYCRVLRPGRALQQRLMLIDSAADFEAIVTAIAELLQQRSGPDYPEADFHIPVPAGPISRW